MKLCRLLNRVVVFEIYGDVTTEIKGLSHISEEVGEDFLFFCIKGTKKDGHEFAKEAVKRGAAAIVTEKYISGADAVQVVVKNVRTAMSYIAQNFYDNPADKMKLIAVTGTNGKTSVCCLIRGILNAAGKKCGIIGTNGIWVRDERFDSDLTTPDPIIMNSTLALMYKKGVEYVVFEASAHAISLNKLEGIVADIGVFTNISQDHLDFFETMERYTEVKMSYFCRKYLKAAVVNCDDPVGEKLCGKPLVPTVSYGFDESAHVRAVSLTENKKGVGMDIEFRGEKIHIESKLKGRYNIYNIMAAVSASLVSGIKTAAIAQGISETDHIEGRGMRLENDGVSIVVDFAHTPEGIANILDCLRKETKGRLITVFGCGGDRDRSKRAKMGEKASKLSDLIVLTEDNSRSENREDIIREIIPGIKVPFRVIEDRKQAIIEALKCAREGDTVAILGKGAEKTIIRKDGEERHSDLLFIKELIK